MRILLLVIMVLLLFWLVFRFFTEEPEPGMYRESNIVWRV